jgi:hypothetical protein
MIGHADPAVADHRDRHGAAEGDLIDLVLDRTGVGIDEDADVGQSAASSSRCPDGLNS